MILFLLTNYLAHIADNNKYLIKAPNMDLQGEIPMILTILTMMDHLPGDPPETACQEEDCQEDCLETPTHGDLECLEDPMVHQEYHQVEDHQEEDCPEEGPQGVACLETSLNCQEMLLVLMMVSNLRKRLSLLTFPSGMETAT